MVINYLSGERIQRGADRLGSTDDERWRMRFDGGRETEREWCLDGRRALVFGCFDGQLAGTARALCRSTTLCGVKGMECRVLGCGEEENQNWKHG
jgi:hypothetical protein